MLVAALVAALPTCAFAATTENTSLQNINGVYGAGVASTETDATGTRTTVVGPAGGANRASGTLTTGQWYQANVGGGGTVGITTDFARSGNGSAFFSTTSGDSKADLQYYMSAPVALSSLSSISYDFYRSSASTVSSGLAPVMRMDIAKNGSFAGSLVFENIYQQQQAAPVDAWTTLTGDLNSGIFWATNAALGPTFASANGGQKTLSQWIADNGGADLTVYGISIGVGSGFNNGSTNAGTFRGGIDNVNLSFAGGQTISTNFEVATAVPEPATWGMMLVGFGMIAATARYRRKSIAASVA
ncbi:hypothetical protein GCM10011380_29630 [Sphingomonas metalli]|uniref:Ice-binding protein C-terminal domain-containing protein n=2 Tax=Sphingomonas metalli TaxID=1779358 RepID=A0A916WVX7_9SPHN|nr:hypothetical protein GCM10011380_29630 [Sphingomonas metalli]